MIKFTPKTYEVSVPVILSESQKKLVDKLLKKAKRDHEKNLKNLMKQIWGQK